jgi:putative ABC transport system ATP-binding protein
MLELRDVSKSFGTGSEEVVRAVAGVSLSVVPGEVTALYGPSGSGKSTLLLMAAGFLAPDAGSVTFDGTDLSDLDAETAAMYQRRDLGIVLQTPTLLPGATAVENAALKLLADGLSLEQARRQAIPWLQRMGLGNRLDVRAERLSGGESQRVAIARALANKPRLILADEPTASLDTHRGHEILTLLKKICHEDGAGALLVTHDPHAAGFAEHVHTLRDGTLQGRASAQSTRSQDLRGASGRMS